MGKKQLKLSLVKTKGKVRMLQKDEYKIKKGKLIKKRTKLKQM